MCLNNLRATALMAVAIFTISLIPVTAEAGRYKAKCKGPYQLVQGNWISTPLCEEKVLVRVAKSYGNKNMTLRLVRSNPVAKIGICRAYGHDIRLSGICDGYKIKGGGW